MEAHCRAQSADVTSETLDERRGKKVGRRNIRRRRQQMLYFTTRKYEEKCSVGSTRAQYGKTKADMRARARSLTGNESLSGGSYYFLSPSFCEKA